MALVLVIYKTNFIHWIPQPYDIPLFLVVGLGSGAVSLAPWVRRLVQVHHSLRTARSVEDLRLLSPEAFEDLVAAYFRANGHHAQRVGQSGDHGIDVIVQTKNGEKWIVQCKRWRGQVGEPLIRDLYGVMHHENAVRAFLFTTGSFSNQALNWARGKPISLYNGEGLIRLLRRVQKNTRRARQIGRL